MAHGMVTSILRFSQAEQARRVPFKVDTFKGLDIAKLEALPPADLLKMLPSRQQRRFRRNNRPEKTEYENRFHRKLLNMLTKIRKAKKEAPEGEKPAVVKTHLRNAIILPEMVGSVIGVHNGKVWGIVDVKPQMIGKYLGEFSITYKPTLHGRPGLVDKMTRFIPLH